MMPKPKAPIVDTENAILTHIDAPVPLSGSFLDWERVVLDSMEWPIPTFGGRDGAQQAAADAIDGKIGRGRPMLCARCQQPIYVARWVDGGVLCSECYADFA